MKRFTRCALAAAALTMSVAAKNADLPIDPGPAPSPEEFKAAATKAVLAGFFDPDAAQIQFDRQLVGGWYKPILQKKVPGWWTCGLVNGKNRMGGYVGFRRFVAVMNNGAIVFTATSEGSNYDLIDAQCNQAIQKGILPALDAPGAAPTAQALASNPRFGFDIDTVADGAYVKFVAAGTNAAQAGLTSGMVISEVNGLPIKGFDRATMVKVLGSAPDGASFTIIGKGPIKLARSVLTPAQAAAMNSGHN